MGYDVIVISDGIARYSEITESDEAYQRACWVWQRVGQIAFLSLWSWTLFAWYLLLRLATH